MPEGVELVVAGTWRAGFFEVYDWKEAAEPESPPVTPEPRTGLDMRTGALASVIGRSPEP